jgi:uncharacterized protein (TIGR03437 family)
MTTFSARGALLLLCASGLMADTATTTPFLTQLLPANETPPITDTSTANVIVFVHTIRDNNGNVTSGSVDFHVATRFSGAVTVTGLHIHNAAAGVAGPIVIPTDVNGSDKSIAIDASGRTNILKQVQFPQAAPQIDVATLVDLLANAQNYYVNIHTTDNPNGAMRGQLLPAASKPFAMGLMSTQNEVPAVDASGSAVSSVFVLRARDSSGATVLAAAIFNLEYTGFDATSGTVFTGFHIHNGVAGVNGPVIINTGIGNGTASAPISSSGSGNLYYEVGIAPGDASYAAEIATIDGVFDNVSNYYINVHTDKFPSGIARDQLRDTDGGLFQMNMQPSNETPPITGLSAFGTSRAVVFTVRNPDGSVAAGTVLFDANYRGFPAGTTFTGFHIHDGPAGVAGPVTINTGLSGATPVVTDSGNGNLFKIVTVATTAGIATLNSIVKDPSQAYNNLHTTVYPGGAIRAQLAGPAPKPVALGVAANASTILSAAPGSIISIYGTGLANYPTGLNVLSGLTQLPTSLNGVTVTIAGINAPFYFVSAGQLNVQVPFEVAAGMQPLVVTTAGGSSTTLNITVAPAAPSIFIVNTAAGIGTVVKNSDFSLVTSANPVSAGDVIVIYSTGLGQSVPASLTTGGLVPMSALPNTGAVSVTIGGQDAPVIYSIASPGFAGLYQTAVKVPAGVSGTATLVLKMGAAASNTVNLAVQ